MVQAGRSWKPGKLFASGPVDTRRGLGRWTVAGMYGRVERRVQVVRVVRRKPPKQRRSGCGCRARACQPRPEHRRCPPGRRRSGRPASARHPRRACRPGGTSCPGVPGRTDPWSGSCRRSAARTHRSRRRRGSCPLRRWPLRHRRCSWRCDPRSQPGRRGCPTPSGCSRSCRTRTSRPEQPSRREGSERVPSRSVNEPVTCARIRPFANAPPVGTKFPSPSGSPTTRPGKAALLSSVSTGALMLSQMTRKSCLTTGRPSGPPSSSAILIRVMPGLTESTSIAQHVPFARSPAPAKPAVRRSSVVEEDRITQISAALPDRRVDDIPLGVHAGHTVRRVLDALDEPDFLARPRHIRDVGGHGVAAAAVTPADAVLDNARAASAPSDASTSTSFSFVRILVFPPLVRYPKDVLRMNLTQLRPSVRLSPARPPFRSAVVGVFVGYATLGSKGLNPAGQGRRG